MAKKKKDLNEENIDKENQDEFNDIDENFGLPEIELNPLEEGQEEATPEEEQIVDEPIEESVVEEVDEPVEEDSSTEEYSWSTQEEDTTTTEEPEVKDTVYSSDSSDTSDSEEGDSNVEDSKDASTYVPGSYAQQQPNKTPGIIAIVLIVVIALGGAWYFGMYRPEQKAKEKARIEKIAKQKAAADRKQKYDGLIVKGDGEFGNEDWEAAKSSYSDALALYPKEQYPKEQLETINAKLEEIALANAQPQTGTIETISSATSRYYVVVSSSIDGDLAMDYSKKAIADGTNIKLIEPYADKKFYRVTVGDYDTWADAESAISSLNTSYGDGLWILKY